MSAVPAEKARRIGEIVIDICRGLGLQLDPDQFPDEEAWETQVRATYAVYDDALARRAPEPPSWASPGEADPLSAIPGWRNFREPPS
jgi:hypothetical protein